ncbi:MAG TPA: hypothetical protein VFB50_23670 [Chloroflexota bacterium]|nr:hypothetical protein [Chloroflexota bacterium]
MHQQAIWHGSQQASLELLEAVAHNCTCRVREGKTISPCAAHRMLVEDQRAIDGLLFVRNIASHLRDQELTDPRHSEE